MRGTDRDAHEPGVRESVERGLHLGHQAHHAVLDLRLVDVRGAGGQFVELQPVEQQKLHVLPHEQRFGRRLGAHIATLSADPKTAG